MEDLSIQDIIAIFYRRRKVLALTFLGVLIVSILLTLNWSRYRAIATVQIEQAYIPSNVTAIGDSGAGDVVTGLADRRISQIQQKVTSIESLSKIIAKYNLYPGINKAMSADKLTEIMRRSIQLKFISSAIANPAAAQKQSVEQLSAIAFTVSFGYSDPNLTKLALDEIVNRFIAEEAQQRRTQSEQTSKFLDGELKTLEATIKTQEEKVAAFRSQYGESGPSAMLFNQQARLSNAMNLQTVEGQISTAQANIGSLRGQLAATDPYAPVLEDGKMLNSPAGQLKSLQAQFASLSGRYGPDHPDVVKVREQLKAMKGKGAGGGGVSRDADNPIYMQISAQLSAAQAQLQTLMSQRESLVVQQEEYDRMLAENPLIEQQMSEITLDLDNAKERYRSLKDKKIAAEMQMKLETGKNSERLKVINPASVPESTSPSRKLLLMAGLVIAFLSGIAMVIVVEAFRQSVRGANHVASIVGATPLVSIPYIHMKP